MLNVTTKVEIGEPQKPSNATIVFKDPRAFIGFGYNGAAVELPSTLQTVDKTGGALLVTLAARTRFAHALVL